MCTGVCLFKGKRLDELGSKWGRACREAGANYAPVVYTEETPQAALKSAVCADKNIFCNA